MPETTPIPEPDPAPEPEREPDPVPAKRPPPPKPKAKPKAKTAPRPEPPKATEAAASAALPAPAQAGPGQSDRFVADFLKVVEKSKFFPHEARRHNVTGTVKVRVSFNGAGEITSISLMPGEYDPILGQAALKTMDKAKARWKAKAGAPDSLVVPIAFKLR
jgi:protein TonB